MNQFQYIRSTNQKSAIEAAVKPGTQFLAGGTNLIDLMKAGVAAPEKLVDITRLPLDQVKDTGKGISVGALAKNTAVAEDKQVLKRFPLLSQALHAGASPQLRNMATIGGNILQRTRCSYFYDTAMPCNKRVPGSGCGALQGHNRMHAIFGASQHCIAVHPSDMCVALTALDATVMVAGPKGERRIPFEDIHRLPGDHPETDHTLQKGELITAIEIPDNAFAPHSCYLKIRDRASYAFALVSVGVALEMDGDKIRTARIAMGGVAHKPWRMKEAEAALQDQQATTANFEKAAAVAMKGAKAYGGNDYKLTLAPNTIVEALKQATGKA